jgi:hypothetical protein
LTSSFVFIVVPTAKTGRCRFCRLAVNFTTLCVSLATVLVHSGVRQMVGLY